MSPVQLMTGCKPMTARNPANTGRVTSHHYVTSIYAHTQDKRRIGSLESTGVTGDTGDMGTAGGVVIELVGQPRPLNLEICKMVGESSASRCADRCFESHRRPQSSPENQSSTSTRWRTEAKSTANPLFATYRVQLPSNMHRRKDYKYTRNEVRLTVEGCASPRGTDEELAETPGFWHNETRVGRAVIGNSEYALDFEVLSQAGGGLLEKVGCRG